MITRYALRLLLPVSLLVAACAPAAAAAVTAKASVLSSAVKFKGTVSLSELAKKSAATAAPSVTKRPPVVMPSHGPKVTIPKSLLQSLPSPTPNTSVEKGAAGAILHFTSFPGINSQDNAALNGFELVPPDQGLAVHGNVAVEFVNLVLEAFDATTGATLAGPVSAAGFFGTGADSITDPQAFFDPVSGHWFLTMADFTTATVEVAVSVTANPLGAFFLWTIDGSAAAVPGCPCVPDFPKAGYDANGFFISTDEFGAGGFVEAATFAVSKAALEAGPGGPIAAVEIDYPNDLVVQPSVPAPGEPFETGAGGTEYLLETRNNVDIFLNATAPTNTLRVWAISNTASLNTATPALKAFGVDVKVQQYSGFTLPAHEPTAPLGPLCTADGFTLPPLLLTNNFVDGAFTATIQKASGKLYGAVSEAAGEAGAPPRDIVAWFAGRPSVSAAGVPSFTVTNQGVVVPPYQYSLLMPAFAFNATGTGVLGFSITSPVPSSFLPALFPSTGFIQFNGAGPQPGARLTVSGPGVTTDDDFFGCMGPFSAPPQGIDRWGDYGAATVDAATGIFYTAGENISGPQGAAQFTNWGTFITRLH